MHGWHAPDLLFVFWVLNHALIVLSVINMRVIMIAMLIMSLRLLIMVRVVCIIKFISMQY